MLVENKTGAAGIIGYASVARAEPDGYSLVLASGSLTLRLAYQPSSEVHPVRSDSGVGMIGKIPQAIVVSQELPAHNVADFVRIAKERSRALNFGSVGPGTTPYFTIELLRQTYDLDLVHVPYPGRPEMIADVMRGALGISSITAPLVVQHVDAFLLYLAGGPAARARALTSIQLRSPRSGSAASAAGPGLAIAQHQGDRP